ncbi:MAG: prepilin-type N-terminal cleavage/methylation domain-containing protein [Patescibacteria group bacterium]
MSGKAFKTLRGQRGFTLVEIIVMMAILTIGIVGTLAVANVAVQSSTRNEQQVVAANLAREGVELIRAIRDSNWAAAAEGSGISCWNYYAKSPAQAQAVPYTTSCTQVYTGNQFVAHPNVGNGMPYLEGHRVANTKDPVFRLCREASTGLYRPSAAPCSSGHTFFRRVAITVGKRLGTDAVDGKSKVSYRIRSFVTWPDNEGPDVMVESYITDWRKP